MFPIPKIDTQKRVERERQRDGEKRRIERIKLINANNLPYLKLNANLQLNRLTCVWDERQLFGPYFDNLLSGSANRYSPSTKINGQNQFVNGAFIKLFSFCFKSFFFNLNR